MSPTPRAEQAEQLAVTVDHAEAESARAGRGLTGTAGSLDAIGRRLGGGWAGGASGGWAGATGSEARRRVEDLRVGVAMLAAHCLFLADVLRVEGAGLVRAAVAGADGVEIGSGLDDADRLLAMRLVEAADALAGAADPATVPCLDLAGSTDGDPREVAELWHSLDPDQRQQLIRDNPGLGSQSGLSSATRDALNRTRLARLLDAAEGPGPVLDETSVEDLRVLAAHLDADPDRRLLVLEAGEDGRPRAVVASADPEGADRVVTLIPGTGSSLAELGRSAERADALCETAVAEATGENAAAGEDAATEACVSVAWQGYEAPPTIPAAGFSTGPATAHASELREFAAGLDAVEAMDGHDAPHGIAGYSYGSAVLGAAAADPRGLAADRMVHVGSAGATVDSLAQQWVDDGGEARPAIDDDIVGAASRWDPVPWWSVTGVLGGLPGSEEFGGIAVDVSEPDVGPAEVGDVHSRYFVPGTVSLDEIGRHLFPK